MDSWIDGWTHRPAKASSPFAFSRRVRLSRLVERALHAALLLDRRSSSPKSPRRARSPPPSSPGQPSCPFPTDWSSENAPAVSRRDVPMSAIVQRLKTAPCTRALPTSRTRFCANRTPSAQASPRSGSERCSLCRCREMPSIRLERRGDSPRSGSERCSLCRCKEMPR